MKALVGAILLALAPARLAAQSSYQMDLTIVNNSGVDDAHVFVMVLEKGGASYLGFTGSWAFVPVSPFAFTTAMTASLAKIRTLNGDGSCVVHVPTVTSARLYFAVGANFDQTSVVDSGPIFGPANTVACDKVEFALDGNDNNINATAVDYFGVSCSVTGTPRGTASSVTVGSRLPTESIFDAFLNVPLSPAGQHSGNTEIFRKLIVRDAGNHIVRVIAPKAAGYGDLDSGSVPQLAQEISHFFDDYITANCWKPNRAFTFHAKDAQSTSATTYYGKVSANGLTLSIYTDPARTVPYAAVPTITRPTNAFTSPTLPTNWHNDGSLSESADEIDWGFVLGGQAGPGDAHSSFITYKLIHDPVAMAIPISIVRGVMHRDDGDDWMNPADFYSYGDGTASLPTFHYSKILHETAIDELAYALSFDDIYDKNSTALHTIPSIHFTDPALTLTLNPLHAPRLYTLTPCRLYDTRAAGQGPVLAGSETRVVPVGGHCGVPATASALVLNVTAVAPAAGGYFTLFRGDAARPGTSSVNFRAGKTRANNAVIALAADHTLSLFNGGAGSADAVIDVAGYFE